MTEPDKLIITKLLKQALDLDIVIFFVAPEREAYGVSARPCVNITSTMTAKEIKNALSYVVDMVMKERRHTEAFVETEAIYKSLIHNS
jgi:hypothetical protein